MSRDVTIFFKTRYDKFTVESNITIDDLLTTFFIKNKKSPQNKYIYNLTQGKKECKLIDSISCYPKPNFVLYLDMEVLNEVECDYCTENDEPSVKLNCGHIICLFCLNMKIMEIEEKNKHCNNNNNNNNNNMINQDESFIKCGVGESTNQCQFEITKMLLNDIKGIDKVQFEKSKLILYLKSQEHKYCPNCQNIVVKPSKINNKKPEVKCGVCNVKFCFLCAELWDDGENNCENNCKNDGDPLYKLVWEMRNNKRIVKLQNYDGSGPYEDVEFFQMRLCIQCKNPCMIDQNQVDKQSGCKHCICEECKTRFCMGCLRHESICLHKHPYYFRKCNVPLAPIQRPPR
eukprot:TRINITY_DN1148_c1_g1_i1.p1 TRINITY_DN1148_c1_g1~~TRINITY_DN1148_c1_g1_i1.p1  ORF type:complete len:345 (-),score=82.92 TRINITY_DN1148_c1_g1_i1:187-1221(-)